MRAPARPEILQFFSHDLQRPPQRLAPLWEGKPAFTEHSYRSFAADGPAGDLILFQNLGHTHAARTFRDRTGEWKSSGRLVWPQGAEYPQPEPIRVCYPDVALKDHAVLSGTDRAGQAVSENRAQEILPGGEPGVPVRIPFRHPFTSFFTATVRAGSPPSNLIDLLGQRSGGGATMSYARVRLGR